MKIFPPRLLFLVLLLICSLSASCNSTPPTNWPPKVGGPYTDLNLIDQDGNHTALSSFKGKVIVVELVGMSCQGCNAYAGGNGNTVGPYVGQIAQQGLKSFEEYLVDFGNGTTLDNSDIVYVQLILYNPTLKAPSPAEVKQWADHFGMNRSKNRVVLAGEPSMIGPDAYAMIPGFQLIDKDFILQSESLGDNPKTSLYTELIPQLAKLVGKN